MFSITSHPACALVDMGATRTYMLGGFINECDLISKVLSDAVMYVNTPLGSGSSMTKVVKSVDVIV